MQLNVFDKKIRSNGDDESVYTKIVYTLSSSPETFIFYFDHMKLLIQVADDESNTSF